MKIMIRRCKHCNVVYRYQASGEYILGPPKEYNDKEFCPDCKKVVLKALSKVKKRVEEVWVKTKEISGLELKLYEEERMRKGWESKEFPVFPVRRIFPILYDTRTNESENAGQTLYKNYRNLGEDIEFKWAFWPSKPDEGQVWKRMSKDVKTGVLTNWQNLD